MSRKRTLRRTDGAVDLCVYLVDSPVYLVYAQSMTTTYEVQVQTESGRWESYRRVGAHSAAEFFFSRIPGHLLPARIVDSNGAEIDRRERPSFGAFTPEFLCSHKETVKVAPRITECVSCGLRVR